MRKAEGLRMKAEPKNASELKTLYVRILYSLVTLMGLFFSATLSHADERPNILFFITDDEAWLERSAYFWSDLPTPAFDRVADQGVLFERGFTSAPSCGPSRACVLTGRNFWELKQGAFIQAFIPKDIPVFTHLLAENGYHVGKTDKGWGPGVFIEGSHDQLLGTHYNEIKVPNQVPYLSTSDYTANFKAFLEDRENGQPFFFWAGVTEPHGGWDAENYMRLEKEFGVSLDDVLLASFIEDTRENRIRRANILYEICYADLQLDRMLRHLEAIGELGNTLIVVTSDNGTGVSDANGLHGKASAYDSGVHVPLAVMWPAQVPSGRRVTDFVNFRDLAPTFLEVAGLDPAPGMTGKSLLPILVSEKSGRIEPERNWMMTGLEWHGEFDPETRSSRSIRNDWYSYIVKFRNVDDANDALSNQELTEPFQREFYDLMVDPWEQKNLIDDPRHAAEIEKLEMQMRAYALETGDPRFTGDMDIFRQTREYVQKRKRIGYEETLTLPFD